jgi:hypothetical protein
MELVAKLRYMGRQYANGQAARGGGQEKHYLEEAADEIERLRQDLAALQEAAKDAPDILATMISTSKTACPPMHYLLTHDGMYGFHMANLWVRNDGKEYTMEADWADNCGKLVKRLTAVLRPNVDS